MTEQGPLRESGPPRWEWDPVKSETNRRSHGLGFETAALVFDDSFAATREDPYPYEQRWRTMGTVGTVVVMVVHTWPRADPELGDEAGRIISARKATGRERNAYEKGGC